MNICLFEDDRVAHLYPLTRTRGPYDLRVGIYTLMEAVQVRLGARRTLLHGRSGVAQVMAEEHDLLANRLPEGLDVLFVNGRLLASNGDFLTELRERAESKGPAQVYTQEGVVVAAWIPDAPSQLIEPDALTPAVFDDYPQEDITAATMIDRIWHLLDALPSALKRDFRLQTKGYRILEHEQATIHDGAHLVESDRIFLDEGVTLFPGAVLNAEKGPIFVGKNATIREQSVVRGPAYIGPNSVLKIASNVETCSFGYWSKVAGELHDVIIHSLSNKGHPGFLGHAVLGQWCNLGADTNNSNMRNDYRDISVYNVATESFENTERQFCGLFMGDHSKCGINSMFNTGSVVDTFCNLYGTGFPPKYVPPFSWGSPSSGYQEYRLDKALEVAENVLPRRDRSLTDAQREMLTSIHESWNGQER